MDKETIIKIYSVVPKLTSGESREKIISETEKANYLSCKFWRESLEEAELFYLYYYAPYGHDPMRIVGILSGEYLKKGQSLRLSIRRITEAARLYAPDWIIFRDFLNNTTEELTDNITYLKPIIEEIKGGFKNGELDIHNTIDDILDWAETKPIFSKKLISQARQQIASTRKAVFSSNIILNESNIKIIKPILEKIEYLYYEDAKELFFPTHDFKDELVKDMKSNFFLGYQSSLNIYYFSPKWLLKWLMHNNYLEQWLINEFIDLKRESLKESKIEDINEYDSIVKLTSVCGIEPFNIFGKSLRGEYSIFLRFPRNYLQWHEGDEYKRDIEAHSNFADKRYEGIGQLKLYKEEDSNDCLYGGLTVCMLYNNEHPNNSLSRYIESPYNIELVQTKEEAEYGLQPYVQIPPDEREERISDRTIVIRRYDANKYFFSESNNSPIRSFISQQSEDISVDHSPSRIKIEKNESVDNSSLINEINSLISSAGKGQKMQTRAKVLDKILDAIKEIDDNFDPTNMHGTVQEFLDFCKLICPPDLFPIDPNTFRDQCKKKYQAVSRKYHCNWGQPPKSDKGYWNDIYKKLIR